MSQWDEKCIFVQISQSNTQLTSWATQTVTVIQSHAEVCECVCLCNGECIWGNNPLSVCLSWLSEQEAETPAKVCVYVFVNLACVCVHVEHWGDCCFHASHPDALSAHCSFSFASTVLLFASLCVCNTAHQVPAASSSLVTGCIGPRSKNTDSVKEQDSTGASPLRQTDLIMSKDKNTDSICFQHTSSLLSDWSRLRAAGQVLLTKSRKRSVWGWCTLTWCSHWRAPCTDSAPVSPDTQRPHPGVCLADGLQT